MVARTSSGSGLFSEVVGTCNQIEGNYKAWMKGGRIETIEDGD